MYCFRVPLTSKIQKGIKVFQSIDENLSKVPGWHKLTQYLYIETQEQDNRKDLEHSSFVMEYEAKY